MDQASSNFFDAFQEKLNLRKFKNRSLKEAGRMRVEGKSEEI